MSAGTAAPRPQAVIVGHRRCASCGFPLTGQRIARAQDLDLTLVRCPECGTAAALRDQPVLGPWSGRVTALMVAMWWVLVLCGAQLCAVTLSNLGHAVMLLGVDRYSDGLWRLYRDATDARGRGGTIFADWWIAQDRAAVLAGSGGALGAVNWHCLWLLIPLAILGAAWGAAWSLVLFERRRGDILMWSAALWALTTALAAPQLFFHPDPVEMRWAQEAAIAQIGTPVLAAALAWGLLTMTITATTGRRLVRRLLLWTVPRPLRRGLAPLWLRDGLDAPAWKR